MTTNNKYPMHHEEPIVHSVPKRPKKESTIEFYVDIEGTLIDDLWNANYLNHSCDNIKEYIHKHDGHAYKVNLFTWGWTLRSEIELGLVDNLFKRLDISTEHRGTILVKEDSVNCFRNELPDMPYDRDILLSPGGFEEEYGFSKPVVWSMMIDNINKINVLIDDVVGIGNISTKHEIYINPANFKVVIRNHLDKEATLYTPDGCKVGVIKNDTAYEDVRRQIGLQHLTGYYVMFDGKRIDFDSLGNASENLDGFFDNIIDAVGDLLCSPDHKDAEFSKIQHLYPQTINPEETDG